MEADGIRIKCPYCSAVLVVKGGPGLENRRLTCPVCKETSPFSSFKTVVSKVEKTVYPGSDTDEEDTDTDIERSSDGTAGRLRPSDLHLPPFQLKVGKTVIGRKASSSKADIQIPTGESRRMSREHLMIEVKKTPDRGYIHYLSMCKENLNATFLNDERIEFGDCFALKDGDVLQLPDMTLTFEFSPEGRKRL